MIEQPCVGRWPANAICDISEARSALQEKGFIEADFTLLANHNVLNILKRQVVNTHFTYESWLLFHGILNGLIMDDDLPGDIALVYATKQNFPFTHKYENPGWIIQNDSVIKLSLVEEHP